MATLFLKIDNLSSEEIERFSDEANLKNISRDDLAAEIIKLYIKTGDMKDGAE